MGGFFRNTGQIPKDNEVLLSKDGHHLYYGKNGKWVEYSKSWEERWEEEGCISDEYEKSTWEELKKIREFDERPICVFAINEGKEYIYHKDTDIWEEKE